VGREHTVIKSIHLENDIKNLIYQLIDLSRETDGFEYCSTRDELADDAVKDFMQAIEEGGL
jgi:hypothetical protein